MMKKLSAEKLRSMRTLLKAFYDATTAEPIPQSIHDQLRKLN